VSAVDDLRQTVLQGGDASGVGLRAVIELADRVAELEARVFPPAPPASDPAVVLWLDTETFSRRRSSSARIATSPTAS
jgi:hypothetical protein